MATVASLPHPPPNRGELAAATAAFLLHHADLAPTIRAFTAPPWPRWSIRSAHARLTAELLEG
jgi:hypothetical protein